MCQLRRALPLRHMHPSVFGLYRAFRTIADINLEEGYGDFRICHNVACLTRMNVRMNMARLLNHATSFEENLGMGNEICGHRSGFRRSIFRLNIGGIMKFSLHNCSFTPTQGIDWRLHHLRWLCIISMRRWHSCRLHIP